MHRIIARNHIYQTGKLNYKWVKLTAEPDYDSVSDLLNELGVPFVMKELFDETIETNSLKESKLYLSYQSVLETGKNNDFFIVIYKVRDDLAVSLSEHIYLHRIVTALEINGEKIVPWECLGSKIYIADTWWETDEEILKDMNEMPFVEFMAKYKAY